MVQGTGFCVFGDFLKIAELTGKLLIDNVFYSVSALSITFCSLLLHIKMIETSRHIKLVFSIKMGFLYCCLLNFCLDVVQEFFFSFIFVSFFQDTKVLWNLPI